MYQKGVLSFFIHRRYVRSIKMYCSVRKYAAIPVQLEIFILQYIGWCLLIIWTLIVNLLLLLSVGKFESASHFSSFVDTSPLSTPAFNKTDSTDRSIVEFFNIVLFCVEIPQVNSK